MKPAINAFSNPDATVFADLFIQELEEKTGVSRKFIEAARPAIEKAFSDVSQERREELLCQVWALVQQQAETEAICARAKESAQQLDSSRDAMMTQLNEAKQKMVSMRDCLRGATLSLYGTISDPGRKIARA